MAATKMLVDMTIRKLAQNTPVLCWVGNQAVGPGWLLNEGYSISGDGPSYGAISFTFAYYGEMVTYLGMTALVTWVFYYILAAFHTADLIPSTLSVTTSFLAVYLTFRRSPFYALAYAANDIVLIILWLLATVFDISCLSVVICFIMFLANDIYGFISWPKMQKRQESSIISKP